MWDAFLKGNKYEKAIIPSAGTGDDNEPYVRLCYDSLCGRPIGNAPLQQHYHIKGQNSIA